MAAKNTALWITFVFGVKTGEPNRDYMEIASIFQRSAVAADRNNQNRAVSIEK